MKYFNFLLSSFLFFSPFGCAHKLPEKKITVENSAQAINQVSSLNQVEASLPLLSLPIEAHNDGREGHFQDFKLQYFKHHFDSWVNYLGNKDRERFIRHLENGKKHISSIIKVLKMHGMPEEIFLVGLIESGYYTQARSHASAVGPWQFIKGTAIRYGLKVNRQVDERYDVEKSTAAAAHYLKDLYNIFGSWELALCAYNAGEYRIINAIRKGKTRDYLNLVRMKLIPAETVMYIPKVEAARELINNHKKYNLPFLTNTFIRNHKKEIQSELMSPPLQEQSSLALNLNRPKKIKGQMLITKVKKGDYLENIAKTYGLDKNKIRKINKLSKEKIKVGQILKLPLFKKSHIVKNGDNLKGIARKYGVTLSALLRHNDLGSSLIYPKQKLIVPVVYGEL